eukprot:jgi/Mesvir1/3465/Mv11958-RA.1
MASSCITATMSSAKACQMSLAQSRPARVAESLPALRGSRRFLSGDKCFAAKKTSAYLTSTRQPLQWMVRADAQKEGKSDKVSTPSSAPGNMLNREGAGSSSAQLLGMKGASDEDPGPFKWKIRLQLTKPVTWAPLIWGIMCGAAASGNFEWSPESVLQSMTCMLLAGPFLTGFTQTINDWYDKEIDAINEPYRPIPSGRISEGEVLAQIWFLLLGGLAIAWKLDEWAGHDVPTVFLLTVFGCFISYIYSAPPLKLKQSGWAGNYALGSSYISLPWWCGQAFFGTLTWNVVILTLLYSWAGLGIAIVNDFKSIEGDRKMGLQSLPVAFGVDAAKWICVASVDVTQLGVAAYMMSIDEPLYAAILTALVLPQVYFQVKYFLPDPIKNDVKYQVHVLA